MNVRKLLAALAACVVLHAAHADQVKVGIVAGITGPTAQSAADVLKVTSGYLDMVNAQGINGNQLALVTRDDQYDPAKTAALVEDVIVRDNAVVLVNGIGTSNTAALIKAGVLNKHKVPLIGVFSGSDAIRGPGSEQIFHTRASYNDEVMKIARLLSTLGLKRIAVLYQDDGFGAAVMKSVAKASEEFKFEVIAKVSYKPGEQVFNEHAKQIIAARPQAILVMAVPDAAVSFMKVYDAPVGAAQIFTLSFVTPKALMDASGEERVRGIGISQVVPNPASTAFSLSKDFMAFVQTPYAKGVTPSPFAFEAYLNVRLAVEAIRMAGARPSPEKIFQSLTSMRNYRLAGFPIDFSETNRKGSSYMDIAVIGRNARLLY
jgi:branched-chain amino acid transport system substrate-binding protein